MALKDLINSSGSLEPASEGPTGDAPTIIGRPVDEQSSGADLSDPKPSSEADDKGETLHYKASQGQDESLRVTSNPEEGVAKSLVAQGAESQIPRGVSEVVTPSGISIYYQAAPKRLYRVTPPKGKVFEGDSVSKILDIFAKNLTWWAMKVGIAGVLELARLGKFTADAYLPFPENAVDRIVEALKEHKLTVNHVRDQAGDRGTSVHTALEIWAQQGIFPNPEVYAEEERGYIEGLQGFLLDSRAEATASEVMVASVKHKYAGRYDLDAWIPDGAEVFTHITPKGRGDKKEAIDGGLWRLDLKTSGAVYDSYYLQIEAYEEAAKECGYPSTFIENRGILRVTEDGRYELKKSKATFADFKAVLSAFKALQRVKAR